MLVTPFGRLMLVREVHPLNTALSMLVTPSARMTTSVMLLLLMKVDSALISLSFIVPPITIFFLLVSALLSAVDSPSAVVVTTDILAPSLIISTLLPAISSSFSTVDMLAPASVMKLIFVFPVSL